MRSEEEKEEVLIDAQFKGWLMGYRDGKHDAILDLKLKGVLNDKGEK
jgi:hypothetical protein